MGLKFSKYSFALKNELFLHFLIGQLLLMCLTFKLDLEVRQSAVSGHSLLSCCCCAIKRNAVVFDRKLQIKFRWSHCVALVLFKLMLFQYLSLEC